MIYLSTAGPGSAWTGRAGQCKAWVFMKKRSQKKTVRQRAIEWVSEHVMRSPRFMIPSSFIDSYLAGYRARQREEKRAFNSLVRKLGRKKK